MTLIGYHPEPKIYWTKPDGPFGNYHGTTPDPGNPGYFSCGERCKPGYEEVKRSPYPAVTRSRPLKYGGKDRHFEYHCGDKNVNWKRRFPIHQGPGDWDLRMCRNRNFNPPKETYFNLGGYSGVTIAIVVITIVYFILRRQMSR